MPNTKILSKSKELPSDMLLLKKISKCQELPPDMPNTKILFKSKELPSDMLYLEKLF